MSVDTVHTLLGLTSLALLAAGAWLAWGAGYAAIVTGAVLMAGVIYARTR